MNKAEENLLRSYHYRLSEVRTRTGLARASYDFRAEHGIGKSGSGHPLEEQLKAIIIAHRDRVMGSGSPAACDAVLIGVLK